MAARQDHPAQEARQGELHHCEGVEANLAPGDARQSIGIGSRRADLTRCGDVWPAPDEPLWSA